MSRNFFIFLFLSSFFLNLFAQQTEIKIKGYHKGELTAKITHPNQKPADKFFILLHGSGPQNMDEDLTAVTKGQKKNLFFATIAKELNQKGFSVLRYHKRSYEARMKILQNPAYKDSAEFKNFSENPLKYLVEDANAMVEYIKSTYPQSKVYLLGHSQGTYIALQVAKQNPKVEGLLLIGYCALPLSTVTFEQIVYRSMIYFYDLDKNHNQLLEPEELTAKNPIAHSLKAQLPALDLNGNGKLDMSEYKGANLTNYSNLIRQLGNYSKEELEYPLVEDILKELSIKVAFFQGEFDNQTPSYYVKSIEIMNKLVWKKNSFYFNYFEKLGHALDARENYIDLSYDTIDPEALKAIGDFSKKEF